MWQGVMVKDLDSKSVAFGRGGSSPPTGTIFQDRASTKVGALLFLVFVNQRAVRNACPVGCKPSQVLHRYHT
ncbi:hypothetical protein DZF85_24910 [Vibrio parahaemolyticus]|nr:hypothetical protein [Vibrio parahaemolyticus]